MSSSQPTQLVPQPADLLGPEVRASIRRLARALKPHSKALDADFRRRLAKAGVGSKTVKALAAVTLGAAARILCGRRPVEVFFEQVQYSGRRLAKLDVPPEAVLRALEDYNRHAAPLLAELSAELATSSQLGFAIVLTLSNAFYEVRERETAAFFALQDAGLNASNTRELLERYLRVLSDYCQAAAAAGALWDRDGTLLAAAGPVRANPKPQRGVLVRPALIRSGTPRVIAHGWRRRYVSVWSVPLAGEAVQGLLQFAFPRAYDWLPREKRLLEGAAQRCVTAAEKLHLGARLAAREAQVRALAGHLVEVEERERRRISRELHDETGQLLPYVRLQLELMARTAPEPLKERLDASCDLIGRAVVEVRRILADLSPAVLEQLGLAAAVRRLLSRFEEQYGIEVRADLAGLGAVEKGTATVVYRLVQECCNNVAKHSSASRLNVWLRTDDRTLRMRLEDDGAGFKVEDALSKRDSFGLAGMQERVTLCGGTLRIDSRPGRGTRILAELPIEPARPRTGKESYAEDQTAVGR